MKFLLKYKWQILLILVIFILGYYLGSREENINPANQQHDHTSHNHEESTTWTCSMHPQIKLEEPGQCPICFMDLIPLEKSQGDESENEITFSESALKLAEIQTTTVKRKEATREIEMSGTLAQNEKETVSITADVAGRIEFLFVDFTGAEVRVGSPLYKLYSPDLFAIQEELLQQKIIFERTNNQTYSQAISAIREKLALLGLTQKQITEIETSGKAREYITIYSQISGTVTEKYVNAGDYVKPGTQLYEVADLSTLWLQLNGYERQINWLAKGQSVSFQVKSIPGRDFTGTIDFIQPVLDPATQSAKVRVVVDNHNNRLQPGVYAKATALSPINAAGELMIGKPDNYDNLPLLVPASAPLLTGKRAVVFVEHQKGDKVTFEAREVTLGPKAGKYYVVLAGLKEGEKVVTSGNFKIDSALQLEGKFSMMSLENTGEKTATAATALFIPLFTEYFNLQEALVNDDFKMSEKHYQNFQEIVENLDVSHDAIDHEKMLKWMAVKDDIVTAFQPSFETIEDLRANFEIISNNMIELAKNFGQVGDLKFNEAFCPMAFGNKGAYWLQKESRIANPYFGAKMLRCGEIKTKFGNQED